MRRLGIAAACVLLMLSAPAGAAGPTAVVGSGSADGSGWGSHRGLGAYRLSVRGASGFVLWRDTAASVFFRTTRIRKVEYANPPDPAPRVRVRILAWGRTTGQRAAVGRVRMFLQVVDNPERIWDDSFQITLTGRDRRGMTWSYMAGSYYRSGRGIRITR
jgi:hypothetical protein